MRVAEKIDWLEFACFYTKDDSVVHDKNLFSRDQIHNAWFGDRIMQILFQGEAKTRTEKDLLRRFCVTICPTAWLPYFDITQFRRLEYTVRGYAVTFEFGDPEDRTFLVRVPMRIIDDFDKEHNFYCVENPRDHEFYTYNPYIGYRIVFTGHNIPFERRDGSIYPVRFSCTDWILDLQQAGRCCARMGRIDVALDIEYPFPLIAKLWQEHPEAFRVPFYKQNRRMDYNPFTGAGAICCGVRGKGNDAYMRIYNKSAEQGDCIDFYPWDDPLGSVQLSPVSSGKRQVYERPWTRIEFELRGYAGIAFLTTYADSILDTTTPAEFIFVSFGVYKFDSDSAQKRLANGDFLKLPNLPFWQDVIDSYQMYAKAGNQNFIQFREELVDKNFSVQAVGIRMAYNVSSDPSDFNRTLNQMGITQSLGKDKLARTLNQMGIPNYIKNEPETD